MQVKGSVVAQVPTWWKKQIGGTAAAMVTLEPWTTCSSQPRLLQQQEEGDPTLSLYASLQASFPRFVWVLWFTSPLVKMAAQGELIQTCTAIVGDLIYIGREEDKQSRYQLPGTSLRACFV